MTSCSSSCCRERDAAQGRLGLAPDPARAAPMHACQHALPNLGPTSHRAAFLLKVPRIRPPRIGPPQIGPPQTGPPRTDPQRTGLPRTGLPRFGRSQRIAMDRSGRVAADRKRVANEPQRIGADRNGSERVANGPQTGRKRAAALKTGRKQAATLKNRPMHAKSNRFVGEVLYIFILYYGICHQPDYNSVT